MDFRPGFAAIQQPAGAAKRAEKIFDFRALSCVSRREAAKRRRTERAADTQLLQLRNKLLHLCSCFLLATAPLALCARTAFTLCRCRKDQLEICLLQIDTLIFFSFGQRSTEAVRFLQRNRDKKKPCRTSQQGRAVEEENRLILQAR